MRTQANRARAQAETERLAAIEAYRLANPHLLHTLDGLATWATSIDSEYNKKKDPYRIVSSDKVLFLVSERFLLQSAVGRVHIVVEDEIFLTDKTFETAACIRGLLDLTYKCNVDTLVHGLDDPHRLVPGIFNFLVTYKFDCDVRDECCWWMHEHVY